MSNTLFAATTEERNVDDDEYEEDEVVVLRPESALSCADSRGFAAATRIPVSSAYFTVRGCRVRNLRWQPEGAKGWDSRNFS